MRMVRVQVSLGSPLPVTILTTTKRAMEQAGTHSLNVGNLKLTNSVVFCCHARS